MDYDGKFTEALDELRTEGRYRVFMDILRLRGAFPYALLRQADGAERRITVWCGNDYLGMGQNPAVLDAMKRAVDSAGAGSGGTRNISGTTHYHVALEEALADLHAKPSALLFTSAYNANEAALATLPKLLPGLIIFSDALNHASMIEGVRHGRCEKHVWRHNDLDHLEELARHRARRRAKADRIRVGLFHGRRFQPAGRDLRSGGEIPRPVLSRRSPRRRHVRPPWRRSGRGSGAGRPN
jgi:5-aminolevulinate synthase